MVIIRIILIAISLLVIGLGLNIIETNLAIIFNNYILAWATTFIIACLIIWRTVGK